MLGGVANLENRTHDLTLHLPVNQDYVFLVVDYVTDLAPDFPDLGPEFIDNVVEHFLFRHQINLCQHNDYWHLESEGDSEII